ncbi:hypothetical protein ANN_13831 [Periplaneta americana]|uniref:Uncharacterized protein n=1 Tax=Periplaneta americana TaxID=6978 RepID=A0ABQ8SUQ8_PERAM|nr:hypothetical protein ANN_13831 [Periplaneta americana]
MIRILRTPFDDHLMSRSATDTFADTLFANVYQRALETDTFTAKSDRGASRRHRNHEFEEAVLYAGRRVPET